MVHKDSVEWILLIDNLGEAREHLESLLSEMANDPAFTEQDFAVHLGHIYAHLNRAWNSRHVREGLNSDNWDFLSQFPIDLKPVG